VGADPSAPEGFAGIDGALLPVVALRIVVARERAVVLAAVAVGGVAVVAFFPIRDHAVTAHGGVRRLAVIQHTVGDHLPVSVRQTIRGFSVGATVRAVASEHRDRE
jgi:hypothetical protein